MQDEVEAEMRRLKLELKQTMDLYGTACKEALTAKQKVRPSNNSHYMICIMSINMHLIVLTKA